MGGTLWEEPIFALIYPGTKLQTLGGKETKNSAFRKRNVSAANLQKKNCIIGDRCIFIGFALTFTH